MKFSETWLRTFVNPPLSSEALCHALTMAGLEVEECAPVAPPFSKVVVAQVIEVTRHPNADRLNVCKVDVGSGTPLQIVCGAPNVAPGLKVPCAMLGAELPGDFHIKPVTMRGVDSQGMLCSAKELRLSEESSGLLILPDSARVGDDIRSALDLDDHIIELKLTPNKADCLSVLGVAREVSALTGVPMQAPACDPVPPAHQDKLPVKISAPDLCGRFAGRIIRGVNAKAATPAWIKQRLERSGQRSISALVDISNYVMLELGRPSHIFDLDKVAGSLEVRWGHAGEQVRLLNEQTVTVDERVGVVADANGVEALAGIMGGDATAVTLETTNIYLEAAFWWPEAIQGRGRRFNFSSDAAHRFERGVDFATIPQHLERITRLILDICGGLAGPVDDQQVNLPQRKPVSLRVARCHKVIGVTIGAQQIGEIFTRLQLPFTLQSDVFTVTPPSYRFDLEIEEDLIEEVARIYGFENIPTHPPRAPAAMLPNTETQRSLHALRNLLADCDYQEVVNFSFVEQEWESDLADNQNPIKLLNPIAAPLAVMRSTLFGSLIQNVRYNLNRKASRVRVFEIGRVFSHDAQIADGDFSVRGIAQPMHIGGIVYGPSVEEQWASKPSRQVDFFDVKADLEVLLVPAQAKFIAAEHPALHPGRSARIELNGQPIGWLGELHPRWQQKYELPQTAVLFELDALALQQRDVPHFDEVSKFPLVIRDLAVVVEQALPAQALIDAVVEKIATDPAFKTLHSVALFDEYRPKTNLQESAKGLLHNEKSLAFRFCLQDTEQTLSDAQVESTMQAVTQLWQQCFNAKLRQ
ncbi:MAG: phenylalanine--tRNA ligase subunit beta [Burkholderiaceae bacterium]|nr:MAG: phenylalanine--tRNA ligase subunit beta [Burkholderiaceae bacterium]